MNSFYEVHVEEKGSTGWLMVQSSNMVHGHGENTLSPRRLFSFADWRWIFAKLLQDS